MGRLKKRADGRFQRKVKMAYGRTEAELAEAVDRIKRQDHAGLLVSNRTLVGEWAQAWLRTYKSDKRPKTKQMYMDAYNLHVMPIIGSMPLRDVRPVHVQAVMNRVANYSESLQNKVKITLEQIFETAVDNNLIESSPVRKIKITKHTKPKKKEFLTKEESDALMSAGLEPRALAFAAVCMYCGLRKEEALGLQWVDIDLDAGTLTVNRALSFAHGRPDLSMELKSKAANRVIPIPPPIVGNPYNDPAKQLVGSPNSQRRNDDGRRI